MLLKLIEQVRSAGIANFVLVGQPGESGPRAPGK
jgi:hypothetical protein